MMQRTDTRHGLWAGAAAGAGAMTLAAWGWAPDLPVEALTPRWAPPPSRFVPLDGMQVHARDDGSRHGRGRDDPAPLVLLHGTGSSLQTWDGWAAHFTASRRVVRFDRPGFGLTGPDPSGDYTMARSADVVLRLLDRLGIGQCIVVGNSSGGRVAWHVALAAPDRVAALVLVAAAGYPRRTPLPLGLRLARSTSAAALMSHFLPRAAVAAGVRQSYGDPARATDAVIERNYELTRRAGNRRALGATLRQGEVPDDSARIRTLRLPTLILWGGRDAVIPLADAARFHADIAGSALATFPDLGHLPHEEAPNETAAALDAFLARDVPGSGVRAGGDRA